MATKSKKKTQNTEYDNTNTIVLFQNDKDGVEKRPDMRGKVNIDGVTYRVSVWMKQDRNGNDYLQGKVDETPLEEGEN